MSDKKYNGWTNYALEKSESLDLNLNAECGIIENIGLVETYTDSDGLVYFKRVEK
jgi:hypothetical protein